SRLRNRHTGGGAEVVTMNRGRGAVALAGAMCMCMGLANVARSDPPDGDEALEQLGDPYLPGLPREPGFQPRTPIGSVQVNVNAQGQNIPGDAANEPSLVIDPTNPNRMAIAWRQFDNVGSNFRQGGYAYSTDAGGHWTFPGVIEPGTFNSDPVLGADATGRFFWASLHDDANGICMFVWHSSNAGQTWPGDVAAYGGDKEWL